MIVGRSLQTTSLMKPGKVLFLSYSTASNGSLPFLAAVPGVRPTFCVVFLAWLGRVTVLAAVTPLTGLTV